MTLTDTPVDGVSPRSSIGEENGHFPLLRVLKHKGNVSQRALAEGLGMGTARVNRLISELMESGHLAVVDRNVRPYAYRLTDAGERYLRQLRHEHYRLVMDDYRRVRRRIGARLKELRKEGLQRVVFYGAGEVMDVSFPLAETAGLEVVAVVDDDKKKQGAESVAGVVQDPARLSELSVDGVVVTSFQHAGDILDRVRNELGDEAQVVAL